MIDSIGETVRTLFHTLAAYAWWATLEIRSRFGRRGRRDNTSDRSALLLAWTLPPAVNGGVYRPTSFLKYGPGLGWRLSAISGPLTGPASEAGQYLLDTIPESVSIHRLVPSSLDPSWRFFPQVDGGFVNALATVRLALQVLKDDPPAVVIASGPPFHNFIAAYYIARIFGTKLVLDYRDEWTECPFEFVEIGSFDGTWEARCLRVAQAVVFTTQSQLEHQVAKFSSLKTTKCQVVPNGWEPLEAHGCAEIDDHEFGDIENLQSDEIVLSFVGTMFLSYQNPLYFLSALERVLDRRKDLRDKLRIQFIGRINKEIEQSLADTAYTGIVEIVHFVPKLKAFELMRRSHCLLMFADAESSRYRPGKIYDYIAVGRPVLVYGHAGEISELVEQLNCGVFVPVGNIDALESVLDHLCDNTISDFRASSETGDWLKRHTREVSARSFLALCQ